MDIKVFLNNFREAFGEKVDFPIVFWFSDHSVNPVDKIGCRHLSVRFGVLLRRDTSVIENSRGGKRTFIGFFDPSVRPYFEPDILSFMILLSRFREMYDTMRSCCLFDTHAWGKVKARME